MAVWNQISDISFIFAYLPNEELLLLNKYYYIYNILYI